MQYNISNLGDFTSAAGEKINISNEVLNKASKLFSDLDDDGSQNPENDLEAEAAESTKAFMEDDELVDSGVQHNIKTSLSDCRSINNFPSNSRTGKRHEPPIKRQLLPEFERTEKLNKSLKAFKSTPDGNFCFSSCKTDYMSIFFNPCSSTRERQEVQNPNLTMPDQDLKGFKSKSDIFGYHALRRTSDGALVFETPFSKTSAEKSEKTRNLHISAKAGKVFVQPFKSKPISADEQGDEMNNINMNINRELKSTTVQKSTGETENYLFDQKDCTSQSPANDLRQYMRIKKKQRQNIRPQPGSLYLLKTTAAHRISLKTAVKGRSPSTYSSEQLYMYGISKHCIQVSSINAEAFQFLIQDFSSKDHFLEGHGMQLADGGWLIPTDEGKAGKEEFYRALCDTPGVDPKLITKAWVYNHYRWIVWKLAAMEVSFPQEFANKCLTPERVLLQLKYRYDVEVDKSHRSAIKRIVERDDAAGKTLILCISRILSPSSSILLTCSNKNTAAESKKEVAMVEVTDGWYGIRTVLDPPLQTLLFRGRLTLGQKIIVHGAELVGSQDACTPLEAPDTLMLKISANSTRRTQWYAKLGFHQDPRPFCLPLSSLFSDGGTVGCVDVIIQRIYPMQWMEKMSTGSYVFRNGRAEEREAANHAETRQKTLETLFAKIQAEFEQHEDRTERVLRSRTLTRKQIRTLQDGAELYEAVQNASDPAYLEVSRNCQFSITSLHRRAREEVHLSRVVKVRLNTVVLNIWRPLLDVCTLLKEGGRYQIYQLAASQCKGKSGSANVQLTATKKTRYLQLPVSQAILLHVYSPREVLQFSKMEPPFQPACAEVDLVGYIISVRKGAGFTTLVYLSDENSNLVAIKIWVDLKQLAVEDIINPCTLISASNVQWQSEFRSEIPTLFAGDHTVFSASPKESHLQERFNKLKNTVEVKCSTKWDVRLNTKASSSSFFNQNATPTSEIKYRSPLSTSKLDLKSSVPPGSTKITPHAIYAEETPKNCKKRKAMTLLGQIPSPPPVIPVSTFVPPSLKKAFQPPRSLGNQCDKSLKRTNCNSVQMTPLKRINEEFHENDLVADEELAMINTQMLLHNLPEEKKIDSVDETSSLHMAPQPAGTPCLPGWEVGCSQLLPQ
uniref:Tower domain-containing protein n=1 Tax=Sphenodon punctatus TaxID=8508 RepID=A0A8D0HAD5_SPHPU